LYWFGCLHEIVSFPLLVHNRLAFAIFCWHFLNQKDVQDMYYRWTPMLLSNLSQPLDEVRLSFHISQLILVSINCATCNMVINLIFFLTSKCFVFQPLWLIYAPFVFRSWLKKKIKKKRKAPTITTITFTHPVFYLICIWYMCMYEWFVAGLPAWDTELEVDTHSMNYVMFSIVIISHTLDMRLLPLISIIWICFQSSDMGLNFIK